MSDHTYDDLGLGGSATVHDRIPNRGNPPSPPPARTLMSPKRKLPRRTGQGDDAVEAETSSQAAVSISQEDNVTLYSDRNEELLSIFIDKPACMNYGCSLDVMNFTNLVDQLYYIDKTDFITNVLEMPSQNLAFFRHRNAMKTTLLKSLECYCDFKEDRRKPEFKKLKVEVDKKYYSQFSVIYVCFGMMNPRTQKTDNSVESIMRSVREVILNSVILYLQSHFTNETDDRKEIMSKLSAVSDMLFISQIVYNLWKVFNRNVILLIDNIDAPFLMFSSRNVDDVYKTLFNSLVSNMPDYLFKIIMMGCITPEIFMKKSSFGSFFNVDLPYEVGSLGYAYFMFDKDEVNLLCDRYNYYPDEAASVLESRYGKYHGSFFNSFSIIHFLKNHSVFNINSNSKVEIFWYNFHSSDCRHSCDRIRISKAEVYIWREMLDLEDKRISFSTSSVLNYDKFYCDYEIGFMYMLHGGYLTEDERTDGVRFLKIPNEEVRSIFRERRFSFMAEDQSTCDYERWNDVFNASTDYVDFCLLLNKRLMKCSSRTYCKELAYHVFLLMIFSCNKIFKYRDEPETGLGIADIVLLPKVENTSNPIVIEIGYLSDIEEAKRENCLKKMFDAKLNQVRGRRYGLNILENYKTMDVLILVACGRRMYPQVHRNQPVPTA